MTNSSDADKAEDQWFYDIDGSVVEISNNNGAIQLSAWRIANDSRDRPYQVTPDTVDLKRRQAVELSRQVLNAATE